VPAGVRIPPSLVNIYTALPGPVYNGNLEYWATQGVVLLNTALTTIIGTSNVHADIWSTYTDYLLALILSIRPDIALVLWGSQAQKKKNMAKPETLVLEWRHPSPMSNNSAPEDKKFKNCTHFGQINEWLGRLGRPTIEWTCGTLQKIIIFTDGSATDNGAANCRAGWGVYVPAKPFYTSAGRQSRFIGHEMEVKLSGRVESCHFGAATNNRAEMGAILQGLLWLLSNTRPPLLVTIVSDSQYSIGMITDWGPKRLADNTLHEKKNPELTELIIKTLELAKQSNYYIDFVHMRGHGKDKKICQPYILANEIVDRLAGNY
jgi:ribonuclease HI